MIEMIGVKDCAAAVFPFAAAARAATLVPHLFRLRRNNSQNVIMSPSRFVPIGARSPPRPRSKAPGTFRCENTPAEKPRPPSHLQRPGSSRSSPIFYSFSPYLLEILYFLVVFGEQRCWASGLSPKPCSNMEYFGESLGYFWVPRATRVPLGQQNPFKGFVESLLGILEGGGAWGGSHNSKRRPARRAVYSPGNQPIPRPGTISPGSSSIGTQMRAGFGGGSTPGGDMGGGASAGIIRGPAPGTTICGGVMVIRGGYVVIGGNSSASAGVAHRQNSKRQRRVMLPASASSPCGAPARVRRPHAGI
jgi:hypothetical protein